MMIQPADLISTDASRENFYKTRIILEISHQYIWDHRSIMMVKSESDELEQGMTKTRGECHKSTIECLACTDRTGLASFDIRHFICSF